MTTYNEIIDRDAVLQIARQAASHGVEHHPSGEVSFVFYNEHLMAFAKLVAAKERDFWLKQVDVELEEAIRDEREACALICENYADTDSFQDETSGGITTDFHAKLIRARSKA